MLASMPCHSNCAMEHQASGKCHTMLYCTAQYNTVPYKSSRSHAGVSSSRLHSWGASTSEALGRSLTVYLSQFLGRSA
jgi:hypothetical protein